MKAITVVICGVACAIIVVLAMSGCGATAETDGDKAGEKRTLVRNGPYYEITGDGDDFGNYFEIYTVPTPWGEKRCIVYSDKIGESGGGAGLSCDWSR